jgi:uncharacterized protein YcfL
MKKLFFLFSLLSLFLLTGCGNKDLSFDEAKDLAMKNSHLISDVLFKADSPIQQDFSFTTTITDEADTSIDLTVSTQSQQDRATNKSKVNITFDTNITTAADPITASGHLIALLTPASLFLNVEQL